MFCRCWLFFCYVKLAHLYSANNGCLIIFLYLVKLAHMYIL